VSFIIAALILKTAKQSDEDDDELAKATEKTSALKGKESRAADLMQQPVVEEPTKEISLSDVKSIIFACDAGMGSSAMGAGILRNKVKKADLDIAVSNMAINNLPADAKVVITHKDLTERAQEKVPTAYHISVENFLNSPKYDELLDKLQE
jgi:mannitol PTS system EIICBA or EIICB component